LAQVTAPVRWVEIVEALPGLGVTAVVEIGPGKVLSGLVRRIAPALELLNVEDAVSLEAAARAIAFPGRKA
jgi:[acyl-carrier-protein] S-malonyltransferase